MSVHFHDDGTVHNLSPIFNNLFVQPQTVQHLVYRVRLKQHLVYVAVLLNRSYDIIIERNSGVRF